MASRAPPIPTTTPGPVIIQWLLDTRPLWPVSANLPPREQVQGLKTAAAPALALLTTSEQESVLKYYHAKDAKMSLASSLLKHLVITKYCNVPWSKSDISRDANGKPCYTPSSTEKPHIDFNVSHQAGLVSLIASIGFKGKVEVGTDVVCANERLKHDHDFIEKQGFFAWVDMHGDVFAKSELQEMKLSPVILDESIVSSKLQGYGKDQISRCQHRNLKIRLPTQNGEAGEPQVMDPIDSNIIIDAKLRRFYAFWCLREAYVKMTGEALLAPWLGDLEFRDIHPPAAKQGLQRPESLDVGDILKKFDIFFKHRPVRNVCMELAALGQHFMVAGAVRATQEDDNHNFALGVWEELDLDRDILNFAASRA